MIWLLANWKLLLGGLVAGFLGITLMITQHKLHNRTNERDKAIAAYQLEVAKNAVQRASITEMQHNLDAKNAESDARAKAFADARAADQKDIARLDALNRANAPRIAALQSIVGSAGHDPACKAPAVLLSSLEGL